MREIVFDTETTGLSPDHGHRVVEIGCVELIHRCETGKHFHAYLNPERDVPADVIAIHGLTYEFLAEKPCFHEVVEELLEFIGDAPLVAHNASFDMAFLNHELKRCGRPPIFFERAVDTVAIARTRFPGAKHNLDALCTRFAIDRSARTLHGALLDAQLLAQVYVELSGGRQIGLELVADVVEAVTATVERTFHAARAHAASAAELAAHAAFVDKLVDPVWLRA